MDVELRRGQALIIAGPDGSGKSSLARQIAAKAGPYKEISAEDLEGPFGFGAAVLDEPKTVIVDGLPRAEETLRQIKAALSNETMLCDRKFKSAKIVRTPNFIFCTGDADLFKADGADRRFRVVRL